MHLLKNLKRFGALTKSLAIRQEAGKMKSKQMELPYELESAIKNIYEPAGLTITNTAKCETESEEYGACRFGLNNTNIAFRVAKTTPKKIGQFVTLWKRQTQKSPIIPLSVNDNIDTVIISASDDKNEGQFIFSQKILIEKR